MTDGRFVALIPARGGSKGVKRKNLILLAGRPLISYAIGGAQGSKYIDAIYVSSEDKEILSISEEYGVNIIERPPALAGDEISMDAVIRHTIDELAKESELSVPTTLILLQPTSPLRMSSDIDKAIELYKESEAQTVISMCEFKENPYKSFVVNSEGYLSGLVDDEAPFKNRQELPKAYRPNGAIYIFGIDTFKRNQSIFSERTLPYLMSEQKSLDIDTDSDVKQAADMLKKLIEGEKVCS